MCVSPQFHRKRGVRSVNIRGGEETNIRGGETLVQTREKEQTPPDTLTSCTDHPACLAERESEHHSLTRDPALEVAPRRRVRRTARRNRSRVPTAAPITAAPIEDRFRSRGTERQQSDDRGRLHRGLRGGEIHTDRTRRAREVAARSISRSRTRAKHASDHYTQNRRSGGRAQARAALVHQSNLLVGRRFDEVVG